MDSVAWRAIRALRAAPTGAAATDADRRKTFAAALRQAEELADAAQVVGYAAKPLPLFYSLSQAGRAIAAAHLQGHWTLHGHGLKVGSRMPMPLLETPVAPVPEQKKRDSFRGVAAAIDSPELNSAATLGELWAANPDLREVPTPASAGTWATPLELALNTPSLLRANPHLLERDLESATLNSGGMVLISAVPLPGETGRDIEMAVQRYPSLRGTFALTQGAAGPVRAGSNDKVNQGFDHRGRPVTNLAVDVAPTTTYAEFWRRERALTSVLDVGDSQSLSPTPLLIGYALPEVGGGESPLPLLLWWALLLGLSSLARYEPAAWTAAIDRDDSELATWLERVLDVAQERVPSRILQSLTGQTHPGPSVA